MKTTSPKTPPAIGFVTVVTGRDDHLIGGYLLVDASGRPLEFHCTAPVRASRAQEILYGATLEPFLYGEQIAATLVGKPKTKPVVVCTDCPAAVSMRSQIAMPVMLVCEELGGRDMERFAIDSQSATVASIDAKDRAIIEAAFAGIRIEFDLEEPFDRIRGAIEEAQRQQAA